MQVYGPSHVHGAQPINTPHAARSVESPAANSPAGIGDRLDISEAGQIASRMAEIPDVRSDRVAELRTAIANGTYETEERLSTALDRLLDEIA